MSIIEMLNRCENSVELCDGFQVNWSLQGKGFGQLYFYVEDGTVKCMNESMSKEFIKKVLCDMVDACELMESRRV